MLILKITFLSQWQNLSRHMRLRYSYKMMMMPIVFDGRTLLTPTR